MTIPSLGTLTTVDLRDAWNHEAHSFTPWLAANLDALEDALGITLELEGTEVSVDRYSADILARDPSDGTLVLIENQLEPTDHTHLGQIMTYLAGLEAQVVVWVAQSFHDAHLSAVKWLNEHTVDPFAFFAVRVKVVRIGDSQMAPIFEVLERPNQWDRRLHTIARATSGERTEVGQFRAAFWNRFREAYPDEVGYKPDFAGSAVWFSIPGRSLYIVTYLSVTHVGSFLRGERGEAPDDVFARLQQIDPSVWADLDVTHSESSNGHYCGRSLKLDTRDEANWGRMIAWMRETRDEFKAALGGTK